MVTFTPVLTAPATINMHTIVTPTTVTVRPTSTSVLTFCHLDISSSSDLHEHLTELHTSRTDSNPTVTLTTPPPEPMNAESNSNVNKGAIAGGVVGGVVGVAL
ncbi:hypothetical protein FRC06_006988, partial [Ceratobasidium sp. 370]